ncbi:tRNA (N6-threonylcarbamoyladenosine(37)-N6)-methyltransferase TrmO [Pendulispora rubella]|uniref:tRNA (N6-threonylcarbamoyladenosine(37)-N6)-methyltransferase TrmO n=1 Tax=Pendulispora rubella TaxID=2741070 RepID=A0ABZ2L9W9_9BACT
MTPPLPMTPIGVLRTPFKEKMHAPRQAVIARDVPGTIELLPEYEHALTDLEGIDRLWVLFWFHMAEGWRPKVLPPRSERRRGLFATRSPHRPNPIGLSCVRLVRAEGLILHILDVDMVDETPVLDIKPYVPYADAFPDARTGWLDQVRDPVGPYAVVWCEEARLHVAWLKETHGLDLVPHIDSVLELGPQPHPYRRIKKHGSGFRLSYKDWRIFFHAEEPRTIVIDSLETGYRPGQLLGTSPLPADRDANAVAIHRAFVAAFPRLPRPDKAP